MPPQSNLVGALLSLAAFAIYASNDVIVKYLGASYSPFQTIFFSVLFGFPLVLLMLMGDRHDGNLCRNLCRATRFRPLSGPC